MRGFKGVVLENCPRCQAGQIIKHGFAKGKQRYRCKKCNYHFSVSSKGKKLDASYRRRAIQLYLEGAEIETTAKMLGVAKSTVISWINVHGRNLEQIREPGRGVLLSLTLDQFMKAVQRETVYSGMPPRCILHLAADKYAVLWKDSE